jgi:type VI secretion system secreted protein VgrG
MKLVQEHRRTAIHTPLGKDALVIVSLEGLEELSRPFFYTVHMLSETDNLQPEEIIGHNVTVTLIDPDDHVHYINGYVRFFVNQGRGDRACMYTAEIVPWLWFLTRRTNCRIFQNLSVPQIVEAVFRDAGLVDFEIAGLRGAYPKRDYCVQYRETDLDFVSRLLEEEGIFYYFRHEEGKHVLILGDDPSAYTDCKDTEVRFETPASVVSLEDNLTAWEHRYEFRSGRVALADFNFETPQEPVRSKDRTRLNLRHAGTCELYDYPGNFPDRDRGEARVRRSMETEERDFDRVVAGSKCRSFGPGRKFTVAAHHLAEEEGKTYVITKVHHRVDVGAYVPGGDEPEGYSNDFEAMPAMTPFRPAPITPKSVVRGPQTAMVVGPAGEEIYTDKHGRVKVKFHWDRDPNRDENSSCWLRVSHSWASRQWGAQFLPRIGDEVIVDFLEGDPDRPIITGRVYNAETTPPYSLPDQKHVSGVRSNSTKGGGGSNEISFDDTKGKEGFNVHGQYDMSTVVEHDDTQTVHNNRTISVDGTHTETIKGDTKINVTDGVQHTTVKKDIWIQSTDGALVMVKAFQHKVFVEAGEEIELLTGASRMVMKKDGSIELSGVNIAIRGSESVKTSGNSISSEATTDHNIKGGIVLSEASGANTVKGAAVMLNP